MEGRWRVALSPNRPLPQGQDLDKARASVESTADVNSRVSSEQNKAGSVGGFRKGGDELALAAGEGRDGTSWFVVSRREKVKTKKGEGKKEINGDIKAGA